MMIVEQILNNAQNKLLHIADGSGSALFQGDCLDIMPLIPDNSIDMILCDLPYGTTACKWDAIIPFEPLWEQYERIIKPNGAIVLTASQPFTSALVMSNPKLFKCEWIWQKNRGSNFATTKYQPMKEHESILVFCKGVANYYPIMQPRAEGGKSRAKYAINPSNTGKREAYNGMTETETRVLNEDLRVPSSIQKFNTEVGLHPTQKPVALFEYLIKTYSKENDLILDNTMGSGTTGVACVNANRKFIGIEKDVKYYDLAVARVFG